MKVGNTILTDVALIRLNTESFEEVIIDGELYVVPEIKYYEFPVINHPHTDVENGQIESHYHVDDRFTNEVSTMRIDSKNVVSVIKKELPLFRDRVDGFTDVGLISNSKLKHKCIHKGKCPHRGYDLTNEIAVDGIIRCPLHGLRFNEKTKKLV